MLNYVVGTVNCIKLQPHHAAASVVGQQQQWKINCTFNENNTTKQRRDGAGTNVERGMSVADGVESFSLYN